MVRHSDFKKALNVLAFSGNIGELTELHEEANSDSARNDIESAILGAIDVCDRRGKTEDVVALLENEDVRDSVLIKALGFCWKNGSIKPIADFIEYRSLSSELAKEAESALLNAIFVCENRDDIDDIADLLEKDDMSDAVIVRVLEICGKDGRIKQISDYINLNNLSETMAKAAESALLAGIDFCARRSKTEDITDVLDNCQSETVIVKLLDTLGDEGEVDRIVGFIDVNSLSDKVKTAANAALLKGLDVCESTRKPYSSDDLLESDDVSDEVKDRVTGALVEEDPKTVISRYLEKDKGTLSKGTVKPPRDGGSRHAEANKCPGKGKMPT
ncbi:hypothetical protein H0O02_04180 [Candidatus Micrarchaeota archaeon]|nr:hypothetical protein [Candidatus Micrarchaeota archaeon]